MTLTNTTDARTPISEENARAIIATQQEPELTREDVLDNDALADEFVAWLTGRGVTLSQGAHEACDATNGHKLMLWTALRVAQFRASPYVTGDDLAHAAIATNDFLEISRLNSPEYNGAGTWHPEGLYSVVFAAITLVNGPWVMLCQALGHDVRLQPMQHTPLGLDEEARMLVRRIMTSDDALAQVAMMQPS